MIKVTDVYPVDAHSCACPHCKRIKIIPNSNFKYFIEKRITAAEIVCDYCGIGLFVVKPESY